MAGIGLSALLHQCWDRFFAVFANLMAKRPAWQSNVMTRFVQVQWQFKVSDTRIKLMHVYPKIHVTVHAFMLRKLARGVGVLPPSHYKSIVKRT